MAIRILIADDEQDVRDTLGNMIDNMGYLWDSAADGDQALKRLMEKTYDILIADIRMPRMDGMQLLKETVERSLGVDVIMITGFHRVHTYVEVIRAGATDFIEKPYSYDELHAKLQRIIRDRELRKKLMHLSVRDCLTDLYNRRHFFQRFHDEVARARRQKRSLSCMVIDIDRFKEYNDSRGHPEGDQLLVSIGNVISSCIRTSVDAACRYGGDEFALFLVETDWSQAVQIAERIRSAFGSREFEDCTLSIGVAELAEFDDEEDLIRHADESMYHAKKAGGDRIGVWVPDRPPAFLYPQTVT